MSKRSREKRRQVGRRGYDVEMIRDFLKHLAWQLRVQIHDHEVKSDKINPELDEVVGKYVTKYDAMLLTTTCFKNSSPLEANEAFQKETRLRVAKYRKEQLKQLEALDKTLFAEALECAQAPVSSGKMLSRVYEISGLKPETEDGDSTATAG